MPGEDWAPQLWLEAGVGLSGLDMSQERCPLLDTCQAAPSPEASLVLPIARSWPVPTDLAMMGRPSRLGMDARAAAVQEGSGRSVTGQWDRGAEGMRNSRAPAVWRA